MQPYNVEIFSRSFDLIQHYNVESIDYKFDYLSIQENTVIVPFNDEIKKGDYVRIKNDKYEFCGYISSLSVDQSFEGYTNIGFRPFMGLFDVNINYLVTGQGTGYLESNLANYIRNYFVNNTDSSQNIFGLEIETISQTSPWTFNYTEDTDGTNRAIVNLGDMIRSSLTKYSVLVYIEPDFNAKKLRCTIGNKNLSTFNIEADLPSVIKRNVIVNENKSDVNKLYVFNKNTMTTGTIFYLHPDGTYDHSDSNRIEPVIYEIATVTPSEGKTFSTLADEVAAKQFGNNKKSNLIEITVSNDDGIVKPKDLEIGQLVTVMTNGAAYASVFTGYEVKDTTKLIFGTIRVDLTKILKEALK